MEAVSRKTITVDVNGEQYEREVDARRLLIHFVRDDLATPSRFSGDQTPESLYQPLRRHLIADAFVPPFAPDVGRYVKV